MRLIIDTSAPLTPTDVAMLQLLLDSREKLAQPAPEAKKPAPETKKPAPAKKPAAKKPEPQELAESAPQGELESEPPVVAAQIPTPDQEPVKVTFDRAVTAATDLINQGHANKVKQALAVVGVNKVRDLIGKADLINQFQAEIDK